MQNRLTDAFFWCFQSNGEIYPFWQIVLNLTVRFLKSLRANSIVASFSATLWLFTVGIGSDMQVFVDLVVHFMMWIISRPTTLSNTTKFSRVRNSLFAGILVQYLETGHAPLHRSWIPIVLLGCILSLGFEGLFLIRKADILLLHAFRNPFQIGPTLTLYFHDHNEVKYSNGNCPATIACFEGQ